MRQILRSISEARPLFDAALQVIEAMQRDPEAVLRVVLPRLRLKEAEWRQVKQLINSNPADFKSF